MTYALFDHDQRVLEDLYDVVNPDDQDIVLLGALSKRYIPQSDTGRLIDAIRSTWGLSERQLDAKCREIWASGFRPSHNVLNQEDS